MLFVFILNIISVLLDLIRPSGKVSLYPSGQHRASLPHLLLHGGRSQRQNERWADKQINWSTFLSVEGFKSSCWTSAIKLDLIGIGCVFQRSFFWRDSAVTVSWWRDTWRFLALRMMSCLRRLWRPWRSWASRRKREWVPHPSICLVHLHSYLSLFLFGVRFQMLVNSVEFFSNEGPLHSGLTFKVHLGNW